MMSEMTHHRAGRGKRATTCKIDMHIESKGDVHIYNCTAPEAADQPPPCEECPPEQTATGACVPLALGAKPKQSRQRKLQKLLAGNPVPSALAASFFHLARRFLAGRPAANELEESAFAVFRSLPPELRRTLSCALDSLDSLPAAERDRLFLATLLADLNTPVAANTLGEAVGEEIAQRASVAAFGEASAFKEERPGQNRFFDPGSEEIFESQVRICRINGLRTDEFVKIIGPGSYEPAELQQNCEPVLVGEEIQINCEIQVGDCPGKSLGDGTCLRVPEIEAGHGVILEGVNFISVDATVRLTAQPPGTATVEVEGFVVGDLDTPVHEIVDGAEVLVRDCRVRDRLTFQVPPDLAPGLYMCQVVVPNVTGIPQLGQQIVSNPQFLQIVPPATARFQIVLERMRARKETAPAFFGSDEVGFSIVAVPLLTDGTPGSPQRLTGSDGKAFLRFGDVDSGDNFPLNRVVFSHQQNVLGVAMNVAGYEIDSEEAFEKQVTTFTEAFLDVLEKEWEFIKAAIAAAGGYQALKGLGLTGFIIIGIAVVITLVIDVIIALWAPADPIMQDAIGFTTVGLAELTSANFPIPASEAFAATDDIEVRVTPLDKVPNQYRERREYRSDDEDSSYELELRYNRVV